MERNCAVDTDMLWNIRKGIGEHFEVEITSHGLRNFSCVDEKLSDVDCDLCEGTQRELWDSVETLSSGFEQLRR